MPAAQAALARSRLEAADLRLRHHRRYTWIRRAVLGTSVLLVFLVPLLQLGYQDCDGAGRTGASLAARLARALPCADPGYVGAPWAVRILGLELIDPLAALGLLVAGAGSLKLLLGVAIPLVLVVVLGRFFCGWLCPYLPILAASNAARALVARLGWRSGDLPLPRASAKYVLAGLLVITAVSQTQVAPLLYPPAIIAREAYRVVFFGALGGGALFIGLAFLFDTFVSRAGFCRYVCPGGATFALLGARSPVRVVREADKCTDCTLCDVVCNLMQGPMTDRLDSGCERCARCVAVCPTGALEIVPRTSRLPVLQEERRG